MAPVKQIKTLSPQERAMIMSKQVASLVRQIAGCSKHDSVQVVMVPGSAAPHQRGESYYWTTPSGKTRVAHPNAYGWPTVYHASTRRIVVGAEWINAIG